MKICIILGTRPEIIKVAPIITYCVKHKIDHFVIHTNQHYSENMDKVFFENLNLQKPRYNLNVGSGTHGKQTGIMLEKIESTLMQEKPDVIIVQGDTNTVLAGALAASKLKIRIAHVEAGLRSYDRLMPEEINRILTDHISDYLLVPTRIQEEILLKEGIPQEKIFIVGNTIVDSVLNNVDISEQKCKIKNLLDLQNKKFILSTSHRPENVDVKENLEKILSGLSLVFQKTGLKIICPIHPRTKSNIEKFGLKIPQGISIIDPLDYLDFLWCEKNAKLIITDSGGVQEEACILKVPCVTIRTSTERPETADVGANMIAGLEPQKILEASTEMMHRKNTWKNPFGDGKAAEKIIKILSDNHKKIK